MLFQNLKYTLANNRQTFKLENINICYIKNLLKVWNFTPKKNRDYLARI